MIVIGVTGNIACGKSTVVNMLRDLGAEVIDMDKIAHEVMTPGTETYTRVAEEFGPGILTESGEIDRGKLGAVVFANPAALARLDRIVHPAVIRRTDELVARSRAKVVVVEAIKLIESGYHKKCDSLWVVTCSKKQQLMRLRKDRRLSRTQALLRIEAQGPPEEKLRYADVVIDNSGTLERTRQQVLANWHKLVK